MRTDRDQPAPPAPAPADVVVSAPAGRPLRRSLLQRHAQGLDDATTPTSPSGSMSAPRPQLLAIAIGQGTPVDGPSRAPRHPDRRGHRLAWRRLADDSATSSRSSSSSSVFSISAADAVTCERACSASPVEELAERRLVERVGDTMLVPACPGTLGRDGRRLPGGGPALAVRHADHLAQMTWSGCCSLGPATPTPCARSSRAADLAPTRRPGCGRPRPAVPQDPVRGRTRGRPGCAPSATVHDVLARPGIAYVTSGSPCGASSPTPGGRLGRRSPGPPGPRGRRGGG